MSLPLSEHHYRYVAYFSDITSIKPKERVVYFVGHLAEAKSAALNPFGFNEVNAMADYVSELASQGKLKLVQRKVRCYRPAKTKKTLVEAYEYIAEGQ